MRTAGTEAGLSTLWLGTVGLGRGFGGVAHVARTTLEALCRKDSPFQVERVVLLFDTANTPPPVPLPGSPRWKSCGRNRAIFLMRMLAQVAAPPDFTLYDHVDVAQCHTLLPRWRRVPYGVWVHGIEVWKDLPPRKLMALRQARVLLINSEFTRQRFESIHGVFPQSRVVPLTYGGEALPEPVVPRTREPWILTVGRLEPHRPKGHREILAVLPQVAAAIPGVHWHVAGTGSDFDEFRKAVNRSECQDLVTLHGFADPAILNDLFSRSSVFCMPSEGEGFGVVYLEAMRRGCIPVGSLMDAAREVIGTGGVCVDHRNVEALAAALIHLLKMPPAELEVLRSLATERAGLFSPGEFSGHLFAALQDPPT